MRGARAIPFLTVFHKQVRFPSRKALQMQEIALDRVLRRMLLDRHL